MDEANAKTVALEREVAEHRRTEAARDHYAERERAVQRRRRILQRRHHHQIAGRLYHWLESSRRTAALDTAAEAVGQHISLIVPPGRLPDVEDTVRRIGWGERDRAKGDRAAAQGRARRLSASALRRSRRPPGAIIGISKTVRDITERNRTQRAMQQQAESGGVSSRHRSRI